MTTSTSTTDDYVRRARTVGDLLGELKARGQRWGHARAWGIEQIKNGTRPGWRTAMMPPQAPNRDVLDAYLAHLDDEARS